MMDVQELFVGEAAQIKGPSVPIDRLTCDSRQVAPGSLFAALPGSSVDGHDFVPDAIARGAAAILCQRPVHTGAATRIQVKDARRALARAAARFYGDPSQHMILVGVTGTNGKTTTVHIIEGILRAAGWRPGVIGTLGARLDDEAMGGTLTTPESVELMATLARMRKAGADAVAMEVSSHALAQARVAGVSYDVGVFTNLSHDHLDFHGTMHAYFEAKAELVLERLKSTGRAVLNFDDERVRGLGGRIRDSLGFSSRGYGAADVRLADSVLGSKGLDLRLHTPAGPLHLCSPLVGRFNVDNILAAVAVALCLDLPIATIEAGIASVGAVPGRLQRISRVGEPLVLVDYAHTADALENALHAAREVTCGRLICVFGCGGDRDAHKRAPMGRVAARGADLVIVTNDNPRSEEPIHIASAIEVGLQEVGLRRAEALVAPGRYVVELDRARAIAQAVAVAQPDDVLLIAGKGHETYQIIGDETLCFDDRLHARDALDSKNFGGAE